MTPWRWVELRTVQAIHARPRNLAAYDEPDAASLTAAYAYGLARNHGFSDGNKRTAWVVARLFLADNGHRLSCEVTDAVATVETVASGAIPEAGLAAWFRSRLTPAR